MDELDGDAAKARPRWAGTARGVRTPSPARHAGPATGAHDDEPSRQSSPGAASPEPGAMRWAPHRALPVDALSGPQLQERLAALAAELATTRNLPAALMPKAREQD